MSRYLSFATGLIVLFLLRCVSAQAAPNPCQAQCAPLNASIAACPQTSADFMTCLCNNLQFNADAQACYNCHQANGDTSLLTDLSTFLNMCTNGQEALTTGSDTATGSDISTSTSPVVPAVASPTNTGAPAGTTQAAASTNTPSPTKTATSTTATTTAASTTASTFKSGASKTVQDYRNYLVIGVIVMLGLNTLLGF